MQILKVQKISKSYGNKEVLRDFSLEINQGEIYGILGPNGSGKTTTLGILLGIIKATKGHFQWQLGDDSSAARKKIGAILETPNFYPKLNALQNLEIIQHIKESQSDLEEILEWVDLKKHRTLKFDQYSLGMKQRLAIAGALVGDPEVLIFDEPTNGLDPQGIFEVRELLVNIGRKGKTILLASHIIDEVEKICDHVAIIKEGKLVIAGKVAEIIGNTQTVTVSAASFPNFESQLKLAPMIQSIEKFDQRHKVTLKEGFSSKDLNQWMFENNIILDHLESRTKSLEAEFMDRIK